MPPKAPSRDAKAAKTGSSDEEQLVTSLVARITRTDLEGILASAVLSGAVPRATVEAMLPAHERTLERARKVVAVGGSRKGTGLFDDLDDELVCNFLARLPLLERVRAVSAVCRSWRLLKTSAELWEDVTDQGQTKLNCSQLLGLLNWLPDGGREVRICRLVTDKQVNASLPPKVVEKLTSIQRMELFGPKIYGSTLTALAKAAGASLTRLDVRNVRATEASTRLTLSGLCDAAKSLSQLQVFSVPSAMLCPPDWPYRPVLMITGSPVFAALSTARGGGPPLLRELHIDSHPGVSWDIFKTIGKELPELEVLGLHRFNINRSAQHNDPEDPVPELTNLGADDFAIMPRLRSLVIKRGNTTTLNDGLTTDGISKFFVAIFCATPNLASFEFDHGTHEITVSDRRYGVKVDVLPRLGDALVRSNPPHSLTQLRLAHVLVEPADLEHAVLPSLRSLDLYNCGVPSSTAEALKASLSLPSGGFHCTSLQRTD